MKKLEIFWKGKNQSIYEDVERPISIEDEPVINDKPDFVSSALLEKDDKLLTITINRSSNKEIYVIKLDTIKEEIGIFIEKSSNLKFNSTISELETNIWESHFTTTKLGFTTWKKLTRVTTSIIDSINVTAPSTIEIIRGSLDDPSPATTDCTGVADLTFCVNCCSKF